MSAATPPSVILETQPTVESLDLEIQSVRDQISALTSRRQTLTTHLLASPHTARLSSAVKHNPPNILDHTLARASKAASSSLHRTLLPTTSFAAHDPSPSAPNSGRVFGVRFENFSTRSRKFGKPRYLLLHRPWKDGKGGVRKETRVHKHSFPEWAGVGRLEERYLAEPEEEQENEEEEEGEGGEGRNKQDLPGLVGELRRRTARAQRREDALGRLGESNRVKRMVFGDAERREASFFMKSGGVTTIKLDEIGNVEDVRCTDGGGKRRFEVERLVKGKGHIDLVEL